MKLSEFFQDMGNAIAGSDADRELTQDEEHELHNAMEQISEAESINAEVVLGALGRTMNGWTSPIGVCIMAIWNWIKGW